jgi:hypothetical protein
MAPGTSLVQFRAGPIASALADRIVTTSESLARGAAPYALPTSANAVAKRDLQRYYALLREARATLALTFAEASFLVTRLGQSDHDLSERRLRGCVDEALAELRHIHQLSAAESVAHAYTVWRIEVDAFNAKLWSLSGCQSVALIDAIEQWRMPSVGDERAFRTSLESVDLLRETVC